MTKKCGYSYILKNEKREDGRSVFREKTENFETVYNELLQQNATTISLDPTKVKRFFSSVSSEQIADNIKSLLSATTAGLHTRGESLAVTALSKAATSRKFSITGRSQEFSDFQTVVATGLGNSVHYILQQYENVGRQQQDIDRSVASAKDDVVVYMTRLHTSIQDALYKARKASNPNSPITITILDFLELTNGKSSMVSRNITFANAQEAIDAIEFAYSKLDFLKMGINDTFIRGMVEKIDIESVIKALPPVGKIAMGGKILSEVEFYQPMQLEGIDYVRSHAAELEITQEAADKIKSLHGFIDAIYVDPKGKIHIIDYKTHLLHEFGLISDPKYVQLIGFYESIIKSKGFTNVDSTLIGLAFPTGSKPTILIAQDGRVNTHQKINALTFANNFTGNRSINETEAANLTQDLHVKMRRLLPSSKISSSNAEMIKASVLDETKNTIKSLYKLSLKDNVEIDCIKTRENYVEGRPDNNVYFTDGSSMPADDFFQKESSARLEKTFEHTQRITEAFNSSKLGELSSLTNTERIRIFTESLGTGNDAVDELIARAFKPYMYGDWEVVPFKELNYNNCILLYSKDANCYEIVYLSSFTRDINATMQFGKKVTKVFANGNTKKEGQFNVLGDFGITDGDFMMRPDRAKCIGFQDGKLVPVTYADYQKLMVVALFQNYRSALGDTGVVTLQDIKCINMVDGTSSYPTCTTQQLADTLDVMRSAAKAYDPTPGPEITASANTQYVQNISTVLALEVENMAKVDFDNELQQLTNLVGAERYKKMLSILESKYRAEFSNIDKRNLQQMMNTEYGRLWIALQQIIHICETGDFGHMNVLNDFGMDQNSIISQPASVIRDGKVIHYAAGGHMISSFWSGTATQAAFNNIDNQVHQVNEFIQTAIQNIHGEFARDVFKINDVIHEYLTKKSNFYHTYISGNQEKFYEDLLQKDPTGAVDSQMLFRNPFKENMLTEEKKCLERLLWYLNRKKRHNDLQLKESERRMSFEEFQKTANYEKFKTFVNENKSARYVPLRKAGSKSRLAKIFKSKQDAREFAESFRDDFARLMDPKRFTSFQEMQNDERKKLMITMDRYSESQHEQLVIDHRNPDFFDLDIGAVVLDQVLQSYEVEFFDETLKKIDRVIAIVRNYEQLTGQDYSDKIRNIIERVIIGVYGENVLNPHLKDFNKTVQALKQANSMLKIGLRPVLLIKETAVSLLKMHLRARTGYFKGTNGISQKSFELAMRLVYSAEANGTIKRFTGKTNGSQMTKVGMLNVIFGIANQDLNVTVENSKTDRFGLLGNFQRLVFSTSTTPDFYNRMGIFVAQMIEDGCYDAYEYDADGNIEYNIAKDARYSKFWAHKDENLSDPEFLKQKAMYTYQLRQFLKANRKNKDGNPLVFGDPLPDAYSPEQIAGIKETIGTTLGFYDHDQAATFDRKQYALLNFQFSGYLSGEVKNLLNTSLNTKLGIVVQKKDADGNLLYIMKDENGNDMLNPDGTHVTTTEAVNAQGINLTPEMKFVGHPTEGLLISFAKTMRDVKNLKELRRKIQIAKTEDAQGENWEIIQQINNTKVMLYGFLIGGIISSFFAILFASISESEKTTEMKRIEIGFNMLGKRITQEFGPWNSIISPLLGTHVKGIDMVADLSNDVLQVLSAGDPAKLGKILDNVSTIQDSKHFIEMFGEDL